jgi:L-alanine-DL-glutamate epimerase-like enolase superfamily enzyme
VGRGECVPYARYGESLENVSWEIERLAPAIAQGMDRAALQTAVGAGAARNAIDCALWDLEAKLTGTSVTKLAGVAAPSPVTTAYTLSLDTPEKMAAAAKQSARPVLKRKTCRHTRGRTRCSPYRRRERRLERREPPRKSRSLRQGKSRAHRATTARERRRSVARNCEDGPDLRRRKLSRPHELCRTRRQI